MHIDGLSSAALEMDPLASRQDCDELATIWQEVADLYVLRRDYVFRYLVANCRNRTEAEDLTHDVFLRFYAFRSSGEPIGNPLHWLISAARNLLIDQIRRSRHVAPRVEAVWKTAMKARADEAQNAEESLLLEARLTEINRAVASLSGYEKDCLHLRVKGLKFAEIAAALGIPMSLAVKRTYSAITKVRRRLNADAIAELVREETQTEFV
jgi:RNA polymerase sigma-70 factor, ECF subfamily